MPTPTPKAPSMQHCLEGQPFHEGHRVRATRAGAPLQQGKVAHVGRKRVGGSGLELKHTLGQERAGLAAWGLFTGLPGWSFQSLGQVPRARGLSRLRDTACAECHGGFPAVRPPLGPGSAVHTRASCSASRNMGRSHPQSWRREERRAWELILTRHQTVAMLGGENSLETLQLQKRGLPSKLQNQPQGGFISLYFIYLFV